MTFKIKAETTHPTKTEVSCGKFKFIIDEPQELGGTDQGPNPVEYILGALSGCLNVVGNMIAQEMGFEIKGLEIDIEGDLNPACLMGMPGGKRAGYTQIRATLRPNTDASPETLETWLKKVEARCPVSDNLSNVTPVKVCLGD
jgi:uncharacterized OsmC-like protein